MIPLIADFDSILSDVLSGGRTRTAKFVRAAPRGLLIFA